MRIVHGLLLVVAGCWRGPEAPATAAATEPRPAGLFTITELGFGPIDARTRATLIPLRRAFAGFDVRPVNEDDTLEYHVYAGSELLAYVVPDDDGSVFNVHATSPKIAVAGREWRVGAPFRGAAQLSRCECWGDNPTCWRTGEHVAVNFARSCENLTGDGRRVLRVLDGVAVQGVIWSPKAFGESD
ncbi:MAG: hypothetical protein ACM31C_09210 [Acidobacteriota bacterium]